ncbi:Crp/Fnr family transcriptional regulator [bacterium]|nr:Crp/Fnr family transcriptional regulator [bacterium]
MDAADILAGFPFFRDASPDCRKRMIEGASIAKLDKGAYYVLEGEKPEGIALVGKGRLRVFKTGQSGREITLYEVGQGEVCLLNLLSMMTGVTSPAAAVVEEPVVAVYYPAELFRCWVGTDKALSSAVFSTLAQGVTEIMSLVEEIAFKNLDSRLAGYLRQGFHPGDRSLAELRTTHEKIAADLGSTREAVSRLLKEFERQGAIDLGRGRISLKNGDLLGNWAD